MVDGRVVARPAHVGLISEDRQPWSAELKPWWYVVALESGLQNRGESTILSGIANEHIELMVSGRRRILWARHQPDCTCSDDFGRSALSLDGSAPPLPTSATSEAVRVMLLCRCRGRFGRRATNADRCRSRR